MLTACEGHNRVWHIAKPCVFAHNKLYALFRYAAVCVEKLLIALICENDLADASIYVIDVAQGEKIPRKGGPGVTRSDLLVINKTDLAPLVGASLEVMASDSKRMRGDRPFLFTNLMSREGVSQVIDWIKKSVLFEDLK